MTRQSTVTSWLLRLITWDGALPAAIWSVPVLIQAVFPNHLGAIELAAVLLPIIGFVLRLRAGHRCIYTNNCSRWLREAQFAIFGLGIVVLVFVDAAMIVAHFMPKGARFNPEDLIVAAALYGVYLSAMAFAMYPGFRTHRQQRLVGL